MIVSVLLWCVVILLATAGSSLAFGRSESVTRAVYGISLTASLVALAVASLHLFSSPVVASSVRLPLGLPWIGANFRIDVLSAFFLVVVNLGGSAASLYSIGHGRHESHPQRVLPFFPTFLAAMNLVVLAD